MFAEAETLPHRHSAKRAYLLPDLDDSGGDDCMRFRLTYQGPLKPDQRDKRERLAPHKQEIRKQFHKQLKQLWRTDRFLSSYEADSLDYGSQSPLVMSGFYNDGPIDPKPLQDLIANNFTQGPYRFVPLVCDYMSLACSLDILVLRRDYPGSVLTAGDLDNRLKTLIDGLRKPGGATELGGYHTPDEEEDPFFCLLEDDKLITGLTVETDRLLDAPTGDQDVDDRYVRAIITVSLKPYSISSFNLHFA